MLILQRFYIFRVIPSTTSSPDQGAKGGLMMGLISTSGAIMIGGGRGGAALFSGA